jgi:hypothetical protein
MASPTATATTTWGWLGHPGHDLHEVPVGVLQQGVAVDPFRGFHGAEPHAEPVEDELDMLGSSDGGSAEDLIESEESR